MNAALELAAEFGKPHPKPQPKMAMDTVFSDAAVSALIPISAVAGILFALWLWQRVSAIPVRGSAGIRSETGREYLLEEEQRGESEVRGAGFMIAFSGAFEGLAATATSPG